VICSQKKTSKVVAVLRAIPNPSEGPQEKVQDRAHKARGIKIGFRKCSQLLIRMNPRLKLEKRSQLLVGMHNNALSVAAMRVNNPNCSAVTIQR
jgi:hypothetical protein